MELKGSRTEQSLQTAFAGESQAYNKYIYYAKVARNEGLEQIARYFEETARNEQEHAYLWFKALHNGQLGTTDVNLKDAADGEKYEWTEMYKEMAIIAREEGFNRIAAQFEMVAKVEHEHEERYLQLFQILKEDHVFEKPEPVAWKCMICGHIHVGPKAPPICPLCGNPKSFFQLRVRDF